jgi:Domain of unknown function (DUF4159)
MVPFRMRRWWIGLAVALSLIALHGVSVCAWGDLSSQEVERAIRDGVRFLKERQRADGSWPDMDGRSLTGMTGLVTLALLTAEEKPDSPPIHKALEFLRGFTPNQIRSTYAIGLQTMVFATAEPERDRARLEANVDWLERAQIKPADRTRWPGSWSYTEQKFQPGDNSNTQYALLGLSMANEAGVVVKPEVFALSRAYFELTQLHDGSWGYTPQSKPGTGSMTCAGISSLVITGSRRFQSLEHLDGPTIRDCGRSGLNINLERAMAWLATHFFVDQNVNQGPQWKHYYLYGLERAGRLTGVRYFGRNDWYRRGAEELVVTQNKADGFWRGGGQENELVATSFAVLFLAKGRAPVLISKLTHPPLDDWNRDPDDVRNIVNIVSHDWKHLLTWQVVDPHFASVQELLQAPIIFFNGHSAPEFSAAAKKNLRSFVEQGGFIFADACCGNREFDLGFKRLMKEIFPEEEKRLRPLASDHAVWRAKHLLSPDVHPLWGIEYGCRTVVIYSPQDLSCYWNQMENSPANPAVLKAIKVGQNVIDYATGREMPADKLVVHELVNYKASVPQRGALRVAKLRHAGDWNIAPQAIPNLMNSLRRPPLNFDVVITQKEVSARDPNLIYYPLVYVHGRAALSFGADDMQSLRRHLEPGGGTLFADAACGSAAFDASFRQFVANLLPNNPLVAIPHDDELYTTKVGFDLADVQFTKAAGGKRDFPLLEGVKLNDHWAIIYSKLDIGCALERHTGIDCKGYTHESAVKIATNAVIYATLP